MPETAPLTERPSFGDPARRVRWDSRLGMYVIERRWTPDPDAILNSRARFDRLLLFPDHPLRWQLTRCERLALSLWCGAVNAVHALLFGAAA